jgi:hypothetical protein
MNRNFEELKYGIDYVYQDTSLFAEKKAAYALVALWGTLREKGVKPGDFASAALLVSRYVMTCHESLPEVLRFAQEMESTAKSQLDTLRRNWPNLPSESAPRGLHPEDEE